MPNPVLRVLIAISALIAVLLMSGAGLGVATADPDAPSDPSEPATGGDTPQSSEPEPTTGLPAVTPPSIFDIPQTIATQLRDMLGKPLSIFGNGRVPGTLTVPGATPPGHRRDKPSATKDEPADPAPPEAVEPAPARRNVSTVEVALPFTPPISVAVPSLPVPGYEAVQWSLNLTDPYAAYTSVGQTLNTVNSLLRDAYAPYDPFRPPPPPTPEPTFRIMQEEPGVVDAGGAGGATPLSTLSTGSSELTVLQVPVVAPQVRVAPPPPITGSVPAGARVLASGSAGVRAPEVRGPVAQTGSVPTEQLPPAGSPSAMGGTPPPRVGYPRYLRVARMNQMAAVAVPGLAGLIALTVGGAAIGYRQANSGRFLRADATRFLQ